LNARLLADLRTLIEMNTTHETYPGSGNLIHFPPLSPEYLFADVYANPIAGIILSNILGVNPELHYIGTNSAVKAEIRQPVHADMIHDHLDFPFAMTVNIPLVDTSVENGATEFWPGTHLRGNKDVKNDGVGGPWVADKYLEERSKIRPPQRPAISKGSLIIRDFRMWHAGIANTTSEPRIMLALNHFAGWYRNPMRMTFPLSSKEIVEGMSKHVILVADYIPDVDFDHLTLEVHCNHNGGNRTMTDVELAETKKHGAVEPFTKAKLSQEVDGMSMGMV